MCSSAHALDFRLLVLRRGRLFSPRGDLPLPLFCCVPQDPPCFAPRASRSGLFLTIPFRLTTFPRCMTETPSSLKCCKYLCLPNFPRCRRPVAPPPCLLPPFTLRKSYTYRPCEGSLLLPFRVIYIFFPPNSSCFFRSLFGYHASSRLPPSFSLR